MLKELQPHYLDLVTQAVEAAGGHPLLVKKDASAGTIYVTRGETNTEAEYTINFVFGESDVKLVVGFRDERPKVTFVGGYVNGIDEFFPKFAKALRANRLEDKRAA